jgi:hypothetical protein
MNRDQGPFEGFILRSAEATRETMFMHMLAMARTQLACRNAVHCMTGSHIRYDDLSEF